MNTWWVSDPKERFWMETIRRPEHGDGIRAPFTKQDGSPWPYYELVQHVRDGDVVLHWDTNRHGKPSAFVGFSVIDGIPYTVDQVYGNGVATQGPEALLRDYVQLDRPLTLPQINTRFDRIRKVRDQTLAQAGTPIYFPFNIRADGTLRAMQGGYLTKFPHALFDVLPELQVATAHGSAPELADGGTEAGTRTGSSRSDRRQAREAGHIADAVVRKAIEDRAVQMATAHYRAKGYEVHDVGASRSYDLLLLQPGGSGERHVEVKGSTGAAEVVELTAGEVKHAADFQPTDLFVVSGIRWRRERDRVIASDGRPQVFENWTPQSSALTASRYRYEVPSL